MYCTRCCVECQQRVLDILFFGTFNKSLGKRRFSTLIYEKDYISCSGCPFGQKSQETQSFFSTTLRLPSLYSATKVAENTSRFFTTILSASLTHTKVAEYASRFPLLLRLPLRAKVAGNTVPFLCLQGSLRG